MYHNSYGVLSTGNLKWLSQFSGMALLNWGFQDYQIRDIYEHYQHINCQGAIFTQLFNSEIYIESEIKIGTPTKYLYYDYTISNENNIPKFGRLEKRALRKCSIDALISWGFSRALISHIHYFSSSEQANSTLTPSLSWITHSHKYKDSEYSFNEYSFYQQSTVDPAVYTHLDPPTHNIELSEQIDIPIRDERQSNNNDMPEIPSPLSNRPIETARDLTVKYLNTYGIYKDKPVLIYSIEENRNTNIGYVIYVKIFNIDGTIDDKVLRNGISELNMNVPKLGFINHDGIAWHLERNYKKSSPEKYRRGLASNSINILNISLSDYFVAYGIDHAHSPNIVGNEGALQYLLYPLFFPKFFSYTEALNKIHNYELLSCAVTSSISIALSFKLNKIVLYKNRWAIGIYDEKNKKFNMNIDIFNSDLEKAGVII